MSFSLGFCSRLMVAICRKVKGRDDKVQMKTQLRSFSLDTDETGLWTQRPEDQKWVQTGKVGDVKASNWDEI